MCKERDWIMKSGRLFFAAVAVCVLFACSAVFAAEKKAEKVPLKKDMETIVGIGKSAEGIYDSVKAGKWTAASGKVKSLRKTILSNEVVKIIGGKDVDRLNAALDAVDAAAAAKDKKGAMDAANKLTLATIQIAGRFNPLIPIGVKLLEYYGRELDISAMTKDTARMKKTIQDIGKTWETVKGPVREQGGVVEEKALSLIVAGLQKAGSNTELIADLYPKLFEQLKNVEKIFEKKK